MTVAVIRNAAMVVAWDADARSHVYMPDADVVFEGAVLRFVGRGYDGPADAVISGSGTWDHRTAEQISPLTFPTA